MARTKNRFVEAKKANEMSTDTDEMFNQAIRLLPDIDDNVATMATQANITNVNDDVWSEIASSFTEPKFTLPSKKQKTPKKSLTAKLLLNLSLWMFYRDCCETPRVNHLIKIKIVREGLVKGALLATKDKIVEDNGEVKVVKEDIIPYQLVKYATDQVWRNLPEVTRQRYLKAVRNNYQQRTDG